MDAGVRITLDHPVPGCWHAVVRESLKHGLVGAEDTQIHGFGVLRVDNSMQTPVLYGEVCQALDLACSSSCLLVPHHVRTGSFCLVLCRDSGNSSILRCYEDGALLGAVPACNEVLCSITSPACDETFDVE